MSTFLEAFLPSSEVAQEWADPGESEHLAGPPVSCDTTAPRFRVLDRSNKFQQSKGRWAVNNLCVRRSSPDDDSTSDTQFAASGVESLLLEDAFHNFLHATFKKQVAVYLIGYLLILVLFAVLFLFIDKPCNLGLHGRFISAFLLSVEAMMTIGYGIPDPYMNGCWSGALVLSIQVLVHLLLTAFLIGVIYQRISNPQARANTILFSEKLVLREIDGAYHLFFRIGDVVQRMALIETHVRCYCLREHKVRGFELTPLRLSVPDDSIGGSLMLSIPTVVAHRIDTWSPLSPDQRLLRTCPQKQPDEKERQQRLLRIGNARWPGLQERQSDCDSGNRAQCLCPTCGETFNTIEMLRQHCQYNAVSDRLGDLPEEHSHWDLTEEAVRSLTNDDPTEAELKDFWSSGHLEIVVVVEGIEPTTSCTLQATQSYVLHEQGGDHVWNAEFEECSFFPVDRTDGLVIDWEKFHAVRPVGRHRPRPKERSTFFPRQRWPLYLQA